MRAIVTYSLVFLLVSLTAFDVSAGRRYRRVYGGCSDPCVTTSCGGCVSTTPARRCEPVDVGTCTAMKIVMVPEYTTETRSVCSTEYKEEQRTRPVTVCRTEPVTEERVRMKTTYVPQTETKTIEYSVSVPIQEEKTVEYTTSVPVWSEEEVQYTVKVPVLVDVEENYTVQVPVLEDVQFNYTIQVPYAEKRTVMRTVNNVVPVTKTRNISHCVPLVKTMLVNKDYGHWENQVTEVACGGGSYAGCGRSVGCSACNRPQCGGCAPTTRTVCRKVWVPNCVQEEVTVVEQRQQTQQVQYLAYEQRSEQVPYDCVSVCYKPETRTATKKAVKYVSETRSRARKDVQYQDEVRTYPKKVLTFKEEKRTETYPVIRYEQQTKTKEISYTFQVPQQEVETYTVTRQDRVEEKELETYTVRVPVPVVKEVSFQVCRMVPKVVTVEINPCASGSSPCHQASPSPCGCGSHKSVVTRQPCGC